MTPFLSHPMKSQMFWKSQIGHCQISPQYFEKKFMLVFKPDCLRNSCSIHSKCPPQTECSKQHHIPCHHSPTDPQSLQSPVQCMIIRPRPSVHRDGDSDNCTRTNKACKVASPSDKWHSWFSNVYFCHINRCSTDNCEMWASAVTHTTMNI